MRYLQDSGWCEVISWEELGHVQINNYIKQAKHSPSNEVETLATAVFAVLDRNE
ncbi:hypothetical protein [Ectobacillus antri]|uniref:hypothetical protein n=1 Tax=Ectobacillus antri TaxID=2486280 RepID=UPI0013DDC6D0|nr:hypothetical protein [Ectobacillus antri]